MKTNTSRQPMTVDLTVSPNGEYINWTEDGDLLSIPLTLAEQISGQLHELQEQARNRQERAGYVNGLRGLADFLDRHDVGAVYSLDSLSVFIRDNERLASIAAEADLEVKVGKFGGEPVLQAKAEFGPVKLTFIGEAVEAEAVAS